VILAAPRASRSAGTVQPAALIYAGASRICHQRPERSFQRAGVQMPVCARCSGLYLSGAAGTLLAWSRRGRRRPMRTTRTRGLVLISAVPTVATFMLEMSGMLPFSNATRAIAAAPLGAAAGWLFVRMLRYDAPVDGDEIHNG